MTSIKLGTLCMIVMPPPGYCYILSAYDLKYTGTVCTVIGPLFENEFYTGGCAQEVKTFDDFNVCVARICLIPITPPSMPKEERTDADIGEHAVNC